MIKFHTLVKEKSTVHRNSMFIICTTCFHYWDLKSLWCWYFCFCSGCVMCFCTIMSILLPYWCGHDQYVCVCVYLHVHVCRYVCTCVYMCVCVWYSTGTALLCVQCSACFFVLHYYCKYICKPVYMYMYIHHYLTY